MMLLAEIKDLSRKVDQQSKDMGIYQSAQEKAARDRHDEVIETIDTSNQMLIARLEKLERTA